MEATYSSETSTDFNQTTRRYIPEDRTLQMLVSYAIIERRMWWEFYSVTRGLRKCCYADIRLKELTALLVEHSPLIWTTLILNNAQHLDSETRSTAREELMIARTWPALDPVYSIFYQTRLHVKCHLHCSTWKIQEKSKLKSAPLSSEAISHCRILHRVLFITQPIQVEQDTGVWVTGDPVSVININYTELSEGAFKRPGFT
jgi:hypothetical protein